MVKTPLPVHKLILNWQAFLAASLLLLPTAKQGCFLNRLQITLWLS